MILYEVTNTDTNQKELITSEVKEILKFFNLSVDELNRQLNETGLINDKYKVIKIFID